MAKKTTVTKTAQKKPNTKAAKLAEAKALFKKLFPNDTMIDLKKVYVTKRSLNNSGWGHVFNEWYALDLENAPPQHLPVNWLVNSHPASLEDNDFVKDTLAENSDFGIYKGSDLVKLLNKLRADLGPNPEKALIMATPDGYDVVAETEISANALNKCIQFLRSCVTELEEQEKRNLEKNRQRAKQSKLMELAAKVGLDEAISRLEKKK